MNKGFDAIAPVYDSLAYLVFGNAIRKAQLITISFIPQDAEVLIIGGGTGWYLQELLLKHRVKKVVYIEASRRMLDIARKRTARYVEANAVLVEFRLGTEASIQAEEQYDVVITHFILDLFELPRVDQIMQVCKNALKEKGVWLFSDFVLSKTASGYWWKKWLLYTMYTFFRFCCHIEARRLPDFDHSFSKNGIAHNFSSYFFHRLITSRAYIKTKVRNVTES